ncbi:uncharacterized protein PG986_009138 [Apiospora aurea]|uniref:Uncharacterized protein n=1 Tax=Apiospora aurea TaxID=335848 RepID=A0ABR1Q7G9_9PEZI
MSPHSPSPVSGQRYRASTLQYAKRDQGEPLAGEVLGLLIPLLALVTLTAMLSMYRFGPLFQQHAFISISAWTTPPTDYRFFIAQRYLAVKVWKKIPFVIWSKYLVLLPRLTTDRPTLRPDNRPAIFAILADSWAFAFATLILQHGVGLSPVDLKSCSAAIFICLVLYVTTKLVADTITVHLSLLERKSGMPELTLAPIWVICISHDAVSDTTSRPESLLGYTANIGQREASLYHSAYLHRRMLHSYLQPRWVTRRDDVNGMCSSCASCSDHHRADVLGGGGCCNNISEAGGLPYDAAGGRRRSSAATTACYCRRPSDGTTRAASLMMMRRDSLASVHNGKPPLLSHNNSSSSDYHVAVASAGPIHWENIFSLFAPDDRPRDRPTPNEATPASTVDAAAPAAVPEDGSGVPKMAAVDTASSATAATDPAPLQRPKPLRTLSSIRSIRSIVTREPSRVDLAQSPEKGGGEADCAGEELKESR